MVFNEERAVQYQQGQVHKKVFPENLNVSLDFVSGNIEILGKQNSLFPLGPVIKCSLHVLVETEHKPLSVPLTYQTD